MEFQYDSKGDSIYTIYWSEGLSRKEVEEKYSMFDMLQIWYPTNVNDDIYECYKDIMTFGEYQGSWKKPVKSLECPLLWSAEEIWNQMRKNTRYEIRRAMERDGLDTVTIMNPSEEEMDEYARYYDRFADSKGRGHIDRARADALAGQGMYAVTKCVDSGKNILAEHAYYLDPGGGGRG